VHTALLCTQKWNIRQCCARKASAVVRLSSTTLCAARKHYDDDDVCVCMYVLYILYHSCARACKHYDVCVCAIYLVPLMCMRMPLWRPDPSDFCAYLKQGCPTSKHRVHSTQHSPTSRDLCQHVGTWTPPPTKSLRNSHLIQ